MTDTAGAFSAIIASVMAADPPKKGSAEDLMAKTSGKAFASQGGKKRVLLLAKDLQKEGALYNTGHLKGEADIKLVASWDGMANALAGYATISELTILGHASPGGFLFKDDDGNFTETTLEGVDAWYKAHGSVSKPRIDAIRLQSCNIGLDPESLVGFAQLFQASTITAWNHFYVFSSSTITVRGKASLDDILSALRDKIGYLAPDFRPEALVGRSGTHRVLVEWYRVDQDEAPLPPAAQSPGDLNMARKNFKAASTKQTRVVTSPAELQTLKEELIEFGLIEPAKPLLLITVEMAAFAAGTPSVPDGGTPR
jgi:hypothetical protein